MPSLKTKAKPAPSLHSPVPEGNGLAQDVLTLSEAATYLRLPEELIQRAVREQALPARQFGQEWRFLKSAIQEWLGNSQHSAPSKEAQLAVIGSWKEDPYLTEMLEEIYRKRGRPMTEVRE